MRKTWFKPELIVLVKGTADERVLEGCKGTGAYNQGADTGHLQDVTGPCLKNGDFCGDCKVVS
jgi:hypothetical protein